jgi:hypothetical protein
VDLHLDDARDAVFDRVLDGDDVDAPLLKQAQRRIQRRRLARPRRSGDENEAFPRLEQLLHPWTIDRIQTERLDRAQPCA